MDELCKWDKKEKRDMLKVIDTEMELVSTHRDGFLPFTTYIGGVLEEHSAIASIYKENVLNYWQQIFQFLDMRERLDRASKDFSTAVAGGNLVNDNSQSSTYASQIPGQSWEI